MKGAVCIGGFDIDRGINIRLLDQHGNNQPELSKFHIGTIWNIQYCDSPSVQPPHIEDVLVQEATLNRELTIPAMYDFVRRQMRVRQGALSNLFPTPLHYTPAGVPYFPESTPPPFSVCFWETDADLLHHENSYGRHRFLYIENRLEVNLPYVGTDLPLDKLPARSLARISLARLWTPPSRPSQKGYYLQLSGWY